jgi:beta-glucosidase
MARRTYSVRWQGFIVPGQTGWHILKFQTNNDGILYIDNVAAIDRMGRLDPTPLMMRKYLEAGRKYAIRLEIFVPGSGGQAILGWIPPVAKEPDFDKIDQAVVIAEESDVAVICVGWDKMYETEGYDKDEGITLPGHQEELIRKVAAVNPNTIVIINSGTPVLMDGWEPAVKGLMLAYYPGHEGGNALASLLFGEVSPSGKLPFTFIADSSQAPAFRNYMSVNPTIRYEEGLYIGYRYIDKNRLVPRYPFGYGLSYTTFSMGKPSVKALGNNNFRISLMVKNTGCMAGKEVVQVYVSDQNPGVEKPVKELKAFSKVMLQPGEEKEVNLVLSSRAFAYYNAENRKWTTEPGKYTLLIGNSSQNILQRTDLKIN